MKVACDTCKQERLITKIQYEQIVLGNQENICRDCLCKKYDINWDGVVERLSGTTHTKCKNPLFKHCELSGDVTVIVPRKVYNRKRCHQVTCPSCNQPRRISTSGLIKCKKKTGQTIYYKCKQCNQKRPIPWVEKMKLQIHWITCPVCFDYRLISSNALKACKSRTGQRHFYRCRKCIKKPLPTINL